jgi:hypothetical protein
MENKIEIPEELQQICRDMAKVAQTHGLYEFSGKFRPKGSWGGDILFAWKAGRHEEDSDQIDITSSFFVHTRVGGKK